MLKLILTASNLVVKIVKLVVFSFFLPKIVIDCNKKNTMPFFKDDTDKKKQSDKVIRNHIAWSMGAGLIPIPIADIFAVSAIQLDMVKQLARTYDIDFRETEGKALITSLVGSSIARLMAGGAAKIIPGLGSVIGGGTMAVLSGASTYALGEVFREHFETGGTFLDFDVDRVRKAYNDKFEKGKEVAKNVKREEQTKEKSAEDAIIEDTSTGDFFEDEMSELKKELSKTEAPQPTPPSAEEEPDSIDSKLEQLSKLAKMRDDGLLTEAEFKQMKKKLIADF